MVDLAPLFDGCLNDLLGKVACHDIPRHGHGLSASTGDLVCDGFAAGRVEVGDDDAGAVGGEEDCCRSSDALSGSRDDGDLVLEELTDEEGCAGGIDGRQMLRELGEAVGDHFCGAGGEGGDGPAVKCLYGGTGVDGV